MTGILLTRHGETAWREGAHLNEAALDGCVQRVP